MVTVVELLKHRITNIHQWRLVIPLRPAHTTAAAARAGASPQLSRREVGCMKSRVACK